MYAVIETGGKQYRVEVGTELQVELLDVEPGKTITLDRVLLVADGDQASIGQPLVANAAVSAEVVRQARGDKVISFKYRPKARRRVKHGHRQELTVLRISDITLGSKSAAKAEEKAADEKRTEREELEAAAAQKAAADAALAEQLASRTKATETETATEAKPKRSRAKAAPTESEAETASEAPTEAEATKPKRTRTKAAEPKAEAKTEAKTESKTEATAEAETEATEATEAKPKRRRTTKKDE
jgi:large subunit ribosomal protein L21